MSEKRNYEVTLDLFRGVGQKHYKAIVTSWSVVEALKTLLEKIKIEEFLKASKLSIAIKHTEMEILASETGVISSVLTHGQELIQSSIDYSKLNKMSMEVQPEEYIE